MIRRRLTTRRGKAFAALLVLGLVVVSSAVAFVVFQGVGGSSSGTFVSTTTNQGAITVSDDGAGVPLDAGMTADEPVKLTNNTSATRTITSTPTVTFTSSGTGCASHLALVAWKNASGNAINPLNQTVPASGTVHWLVSIAADASTPASCASASWTATYSGTTS